ncbi:MAG: PAS domain S-box protein [Bacteroidota bacterium]
MAVLPENEIERLQALINYDILDTAYEAEFDRLTELAAIICGVPISLITLLDENRQWFKSKKGLPVPETPRNISFCQYAITGDSLFEIQDANNDDRFRDNPLVTGDPNIRFYAGFPLTDPSGFSLGTLCVIDRSPRTLNDDQRRALQIISKEVISQIISRKERKDLKDLERLFSFTSDLICITGSDQFFKKTNPAFTEVLGWDKKDLLQHPIPFFMNPADIAETKKETDKFSTDVTTINFTNRFRTKDGNHRLINWAANFDPLTGLVYSIGRDMTSQKEIELDLIRTKEMLEAVSKVGRVGGWELNLLENTNSWSSVTKEIHEVAPDFVPEMNKGIQFYREGFHRERITKLVQRAIDFGESFEAELQIITAKQNVKWVRSIGKPEFENGKCVRIYGIFQDINDQKLKEEIISVSEKRFRQTFDYAASGMFLLDPHTECFLEVNESFTKLAGVGKHLLIGLNFENIIHVQDERNLKQMFAELISGTKVSMSSQLRFVTRNGETVWVEMVASALKEEQGEIINIIGQVQNITARVHAERKLQLSEEKHRGFFEHSQGLMCTHDLSGNFLTVNPTGASLLGYSTDEFLDKSLYDIVDPQYKDMVTDYLKEIVSNGYYKGLMKLLHRNGMSKTWMYNNVVAELIDGRKYVIGNAVDITERIIMERNLHKAKELAVKNAQAKDVFLANMSHEIRTPMNAITGFAHLLRDTPLNAEQTKYVSYINTSSENLLGIINDILDFSKIESGHISIESIPFNIRDLVGNVRAVLNHKAADKNLKLSYDIETNIPEFVNGDPTRLNQVLINLTNNAIKFTEQGWVKIAVQLKEELHDTVTVQFSINDSGIGIEENKLQAIFNRFTQADSDTTRKYGGTGLGLSISKSLVEIQNGKIWVESTLGVGSSFNFTLTYKKDDGQALKSRRRTGVLKSERQVKVLLVEDNLLNQKLAMKVLENFNFLPELAENGRQAIEMIKNKNYEVILMDLQMPEMDGYQATEYIRMQLKISTPIIAMTAHSLVGERDKCIAIGMNDYIPKPFVQEEVFNKIMHYVQPDIVVKESSGQTVVPDLSYLKDLSGGSHDFLKEMIQLFISQTPVEMQAMNNAYTESDHRAIKRLAHKLSSSFSLMGINEDGILKILQEDSDLFSDNLLLREKLDYLQKVFDESVIFLNKELIQ